MNKELKDEFHNEYVNHFTNYDYVLQLCDNGQSAVFREFIKELSPKSLVKLLTHNLVDLGSYRTGLLTEEISRRME